MQILKRSQAGSEALGKRRRGSEEKPPCIFQMGCGIIAKK
jgi:hypothetical protein